MPKPIVDAGEALPAATRCASRPSASDRGHGDIEYQRHPHRPADIERAVVNLLRLHEAGRDAVLRDARQRAPYGMPA
jgi:ATP-dependent RNA helicase DeaD